MEIAPAEGCLDHCGTHFGQWMWIQFIGLPVRDAYDPKSENFVMPFPAAARLQC